MINRAPKLDQEDGGKDILDVLPKHPVRIDGSELHLGSKLELLDENGKLMATVRRNFTGNTQQERSYTLELAGGFKVLLPIPYFCNTPSYLIDVLANEDLEIAVPEYSKKQHCRVVDTRADDISSIRPKIVEKKELQSEWQEIPLHDDQCLTFEARHTGVLARLYKVPHTDEFILRGPDGVVLKHYKEGDQQTLESSSGKKLFMEVRKGAFRVKGQMSFTLNVESIEKITKIEAGLSDSFEVDNPFIIKGLINGGRQVALTSYREVGKVKEELLHRNEDNAGFNTDTLVVADGLGGHFHGALASDYAVETLLNSKGDFKKGVQETHDRMDMFTSYYKDLVERKQQGEAVELNDEWYQLPPIVPQQKSGKKKKEPKEISVPDAVIAAVRFEGDKLKTMVLGDSRIYVVRGDKVVYRSRKHTYVEKLVERGEMTPRQAMTSELSSTVLTTLVGAFAPDYDEFDLQKGDRVVLVSDGMDLPESVIVECVKDKSAEEGVLNLLKEKQDENNGGGSFYDLNDGEAPVAVRTWDNATGAVVVHD